MVPALLDAVQFEQGEHQGFYDQTSDRWFKITLAGKAGFVLRATQPEDDCRASQIELLLAIDRAGG